MGLINWLKDKRMQEISFDIKSLKKEYELLEERFEALQTQVRSMRTLVYRRKYNQEDENTEDKEEKQPADLQQLQRELLGMR